MNINTPNNNYSNQNNYGSDGMGGDYGYTDPNLQSWVQQAQSYQVMYQQYLQTLSVGGIDNSERQSYQTVMGYLNQLSGWMAEYGIDTGGSGWDPMQGDGFGGGVDLGGPDGMGFDGSDGMGVGGQPQGPSFPVSYQDQTHVVSEDGSDVSITVGRNDTDTRDIDFYQPNGEVIIPSNAASANVEGGTDEAGKPLVTVTITFPGGANRVLHFHDPENLKIKAAKKENVVPNASLTSNTVLAGKVKVEGLGSKNEDSKQLGDEPTSTEGDTKTYDGTDFNIAASPDGTDEKINVLASGDVTLLKNSNSEYYVISYDATTKKYTVKVYASQDDITANKVMSTMTIDGELLNHLNLEIDPSRVKFEAPIGTADGKLDTTNAAAKKIKFSGDGAPAELPKTLQGLVDATGKTEEDILTALKAAGYTQFDTIEDLTAAMTGGTFPPSAPDEKMLKFLTELDPTLEASGTEQKWETLLNKLYEGSDHVIKVGEVKADATHSTVSFTFDANIVIYDFTNDKILDPGSQWPMSSAILDNWTMNHDGDESSYGGKSYRGQLVGKIGAAFLTKNFADAVAYINGMPSNIGNDVIRDLVNVLDKISGGNPKALLQLLPPEVRNAMIQKVMEKGDELTEKNGANRNSEETARLIQESLSNN